MNSNFSVWTIPPTIDISISARTEESDYGTHIRIDNVGDNEKSPPERYGELILRKDYVVSIVPLTQESR